MYLWAAGAGCTFKLCTVGVFGALDGQGIWRAAARRRCILYVGMYSWHLWALLQDSILLAAGFSYAFVALSLFCTVICRCHGMVCCSVWRVVMCTWHVFLFSELLCLPSLSFAFPRFVTGSSFL